MTHHYPGSRVRVNAWSSGLEGECGTVLESPDNYKTPPEMAFVAMDVGGRRWWPHKWLDAIPVESPKSHTIWHLRYELNGWTDPWGNNLPGYVVDKERTIHEIGPYVYNDGYENVNTIQAVDDGGRHYYKRLPIDYAGNPSWVRIDHDENEGEPRFWAATLPEGKTRLLTPTGHKYTKTT